MVIIYITFSEIKVNVYWSKITIACMNGKVYYMY